MHNGGSFIESTTPGTEKGVCETEQATSRRRWYSTEHDTSAMQSNTIARGSSEALRKDTRLSSRVVLPNRESTVVAEDSITCLHV